MGKKSFSLGLMLVAAAAAGLGTSRKAAATGTLGMLFSPSGICKGSSGYGGEYFYFANRYLENTSASTQYLVCGGAQIWDQTLPKTYDGTLGYFMSIGLKSTTTAAAPFTCSAVLGYEGQESSYETILTKTVSIGSGSVSTLYFYDTDPAMKIKTEDAMITANCAIPGGGHVKWFYVRQPKNF